jgi:lysozyme
MKTSNVGIQLIQEFESLHDGDLTMIGLQPKMDPIGIWTEGYGHAMRDSKGF